METLLAPDDGTLYGRLAHWLIDASEQDIAAYWAAYQIGKRSNDITDLVFINWARLNPQGAIAAVAGKADEHHAWWAWACHDPKAALAAAIAANPDRVNNVAWGIGEFHPQWLREHIDQIPESGRGDAMSGFAKWDDGANPLEALKFMKEHKMGFDQGTFKALVNQDPWAALDWIKENSALQASRYASDKDPMGILLATMSSQHPDDLERLAAQTPTSELKRKMESALFENLLATDPAAALAQAKATEIPLIAAERLEKVGLSLVKSDPEQAFQLARDILAANPDSQVFQMTIEYENGRTSWGSPTSPGSALMQALLAKDPARILEMTIQEGQDPTETFNNLAGNWATADLLGFTTWVNGQTNPAIRNRAAQMVVEQLREQGQFSEAADWAMSSETNKANGYLFNTLNQWQKADPDKATRWLESADLPDKEKTRLRENLKNSANPSTE